MQCNVCSSAEIKQPKALTTEKQSSFYNDIKMVVFTIAQPNEKAGFYACKTANGTISSKYTFSIDIKDEHEIFHWTQWSDWPSCRKVGIDTIKRTRYVKRSSILQLIGLLFGI